MLRSKKAEETLLNVFNKSSEVIVLDCETSGFKSDFDRVIQFSGIKFVVFNGIMAEKERLNIYINPEFALPKKITEITGITDEMLSVAKKEKDIFPDIYAFLGETPIICGQNIPFDIRFIKTMYERYGRTLTPRITLDTLEMARDLLDSKQVPNNKLETLADFFGVSNKLKFHNAMDDVIACSRLVQIFYWKYKERKEQHI